MGGIKLLRLQMIHWSCFHLMGNPISCIQFQQHHRRPPPVQTIKLINSDDGLIKIYNKPVHVSQVMQEFPKYMVCRSDSFYIGQKIQALSENDHLQLGHNYFLLPNHFFQSVLSFVTISSFASSCKSQSINPGSNIDNPKNMFIRKVAASCQPFDIQKSPSGFLRIRVSEEFISQLLIEQEKMKEEEKMKSRVCTTPELQKDYKQLVGGSRDWKPKLETIRESREKKRKLSSFGMKRRKRSHSMTTQKSKHNHHYHHLYVSSSTSCTNPLSKYKIKRASKSGYDL